MKANELQIGDWVRPTRLDRAAKLVSIDGLDMRTILECTDYHSSHILECNPIPLTPEILEKNGFEGKQFFSELICKDWQFMCDCQALCGRSEDGWIIDIPCCYVHELQHVLRLCGIEKEIEL